MGGSGHYYCFYLDDAVRSELNQCYHQYRWILQSWKIALLARHQQSAYPLPTHPRKPRRSERNACATGPPVPVPPSSPPPRTASPPA